MLCLKFILSFHFLHSNLSLVFPDMLEIKALITNVTLARQGPESTLRPATTSSGPSSSKKAGAGSSSGGQRPGAMSELLTPAPSFSTAQLAQFRKRLRSSFIEGRSRHILFYEFATRMCSVFVFFFPT